MKAILVAGVLALIAGGCVSPGHEPSPEMVALRTTAAAKAAPDFVQGGPAEIMLSQQFILHSKEAGRDYLVQVCMPIPFNPTAKAKDIDTMFPGRDAAAVYVLDGGTDFGVYCAADRNVFTVGIAPFGFKLGELVDARFRDFTHFPYSGAPVSGGGAKFEAFVKEELRPFIESRYPVDPKKAVLAGYSLGGLFALNVLANDPGAFSGYLIGDPSSGDATLGQRLRASGAKANGERVYLGVGDLNRPGVRPEIDALTTNLQAADTKLVMKLQEFAGETHGSAQPFVIARGLEWMFTPPPPKPAN